MTWHVEFASNNTFENYFWIVNNYEVQAERKPFTPNADEKIMKDLFQYKERIHATSLSLSSKDPVIQIVDNNRRRFLWAKDIRILRVNADISTVSVRAV